VNRLRHLIVIVPGIGGSVLVTPQEATAWSTGRRVLAQTLAWPERLSLADHPDLVPVDAVPSVRVLPWKVIHGYDGLIGKIEKTFANVRVDVARPAGGRTRPRTSWCSPMTSGGGSGKPRTAWPTRSENGSPTRHSRAGAAG
jgi:hypothetical protein